MICVNSVSVYPKSILLKVGTWSYAAYAEVCPSNADCKEVQWHSDNSSVASVNASSGYICANGVGTAHIYATATDGSGCSDYLTVTVSNTVPVTSVTLNPSSLSLEEGQTSSLSATVCPDNATNKNVNWTSSNSSVATVSGGVVTAVSKGSAKITATAADGSAHFDCCTVTVTGDILATCISVSPSYKELAIGGSCYLTENVVPSNVTNKTVFWLSSNNQVASVNSSGLVYANGTGTAIIYATAQDGSGVYGTCTVSVSSPAVTSISVYPKQKTLAPGETTTLYATIEPQTSSPASLVWTSSDTSVATVGTYTGIVTALTDGTAIITARTVNDEKTDSSTITVDSREKVIIKKDNESFYVQFSDGSIWKNIGCDLSLSENRSGYPMWDSDSNLLFAQEKRYIDNTKNNFSIKQIAYLYLIDPLGIEYYMKNDACKKMDILSGEYLHYKDAVYEAIFGTSERENGRFYFKIVNNVPVYGRYENNNSRTDYYSNAEIIFGSHTIFNWSSFWQSIGETIFENIPVISHILLGVEMYQALFYSGSIVSAMSGVASEFLDDYAKKTENTVLEKMLGWPKTVFDCFTALADALVGAFELNNLKDMDIYAKIQEQDYRTVFDRYGSELTIQEIISKCTNT